MGLQVTLESGTPTTTVASAITAPIASTSARVRRIVDRLIEGLRGAITNQGDMDHQLATNEAAGECTQVSSQKNVRIACAACALWMGPRTSMEERDNAARPRVAITTTISCMHTTGCIARRIALHLTRTLCGRTASAGSVQGSSVPHQVHEDPEDGPKPHN